LCFREAQGEAAKVVGSHGSHLQRMEGGHDSMTGQKLNLPSQIKSHFQSAV
jgi:hypothetical protein